MKRGTLMAVGLFAALLAVVLLTREDKVSEGVPHFSWQAPDQSAVTKVEIDGAKRALLLKRPEGWRVADPTKPEETFATDEGLVTSLLGALGEVKASDFVTAKAERHAELEVDDAKGLKVTVSGEKGPLGALIVGKASQSGGQYLRRPGAPEVFTTAGRLASLARRDVNGWRKRTILSVKAEELASLTVTSEDAMLTLVQKDGVWAAEPPPPAGFRFDAAAAQRLVQQFASLSAQDFSAPGTAETPPVATLSARTKDGRTLEVRFGAEANGAVPTRVAGDAQAYLVAPYLVKQLTKHLDDLRDLSLWAFEPDAVRRFALVAGAKRVTLAKEASGWKLLEPSAAPPDFDVAQVPSVLARLRALRAVRMDASPAARAACGKPPAVTLELTLEGTTTQRLRLAGAIGDAEVCGMGSADALTYAVAKGDRTWLEGGVELFKRPPPMPQGGMQGLDQLPPELRAKLMEQLRQRQLQH